MSETAETIGYMVALCVGLIVVICVFLMLCWFIGIVAAETYKRLRRTYHLSVIGYWLVRLEKGGMREFQRAEDYKIAYKAMLEAAKDKPCTAPNQ